MDFCISGAPLRERACKPQNGEMFVIHISDKRFVFRVKNFYKAIRKRQPAKKWTKTLNSHIIREDNQMARKYMKICLISFLI